MDSSDSKGCNYLERRETKETKHTLDFSEAKETKHTLDFSEAEIDLITRMYKLVGDRWSIIAGRIPGRSAEEIEKYWISTHPSSH